MLVLNEMQMTAIAGGVIKAVSGGGHYVTHYSVDEDGNDVETQEWVSDGGEGWGGSDSSGTSTDSGSTTSDPCEGLSKLKCVKSDNFVPEKSNGQTTVATAEVVKAIVGSKDLVAVTSGSVEKIGFVVADGTGLKVVLGANVQTGSTSSTDTASANVPAGAVAVVHGHIDGESAGVQSPADAVPLRSGLPNGVVSEGRVGVTEIVNGQLIFRMLEGTMTNLEAKQQKQNLNNQQPQFQKD